AGRDPRGALEAAVGPVLTAPRAAARARLRTRAAGGRSVGPGADGRDAPGNARAPRRARPRARGLHARIIRSAAPFGRNPRDVLRGILDVARLAVHAIRRVDAKARDAASVREDLVDSGRTIALSGLVVARQIHCDRH